MTKILHSNRIIILCGLLTYSALEMRVLFFIVPTLAGENTLVMKVRQLELRVLIEAGVSFVATVGKLSVLLVK